MDSFPFRLKDSPEDFKVVERSEFPIDSGPFAVYLLRKRDIGTLEALDALRPKLHSSEISFGGLKDKYASSEQFVTALHGPPTSIRIELAELEYVGQAARPFESRDISANGFSITLRDMEADVCNRLEAKLATAADWHTPNYFDEQRFGSLGESGMFAAEPWCRGNHEAVIRLVLTDSNPHDQSGDRREKKLIAEYWNAWHELPTLHSQVRHEVVLHLANRPGDYRGAITRIPHSLRSLLLAAFQSALWNRWLSAEIEARIDASSLRRFQIANAALAMPTENADFLDGFDLPLPTARHPLEEGPSALRMTEILKDYNLEYRELRVKYPRDTFFSKGLRPTGFQPRDLKWLAADDERFSSRRKLTLEFELPRGCYATMFVRRLAA